MNTNDPMTKEELDAIQARADSVTTLRTASFNDWQELALLLSEDVDTLIAEVKRLRALTTADEDMVKRATHAIAAHWHDMHTGGSLGRQEALAIAALEAAFSAGGES